MSRDVRKAFLRWKIFCDLSSAFDLAYNSNGFISMISNMCDHPASKILQSILLSFLPAYKNFAIYTYRKTRCCIREQCKGYFMWRSELFPHKKQGFLNGCSIKEEHECLSEVSKRQLACHMLPFSLTQAPIMADKRYFEVKGRGRKLNFLLVLKAAVPGVP